MAVKILHAADFHLDSPFQALPDEKAALRRKEQRNLLYKIAELAISEGIELLLLSGDLFDSSASYWETQETILQVFSSIKCPIFIAPGNHDYFCPKSPYSHMELPENVHIFKKSSVSSVKLPELNCRVWGAGFTSTRSAPLLSGFAAPEDNILDIMVLHGSLTDDDYNLITESEIKNSGLSYLALGHVHSFSGIKKAGNTYYAYPGAPEGRGFDETGEKGVIIGTVDKSSCDLKFVPLPGRRYDIREFNITGFDDVAAALDSALKGSRTEDVVRLILKGECDAPVDEGAISEKFNEKFFSFSLINKTIPAKSIWSGADSDSLTGLFLTAMKEKYDAAKSDRDRERITNAVRYALAALESREEWRP